MRLIDADKLKQHYAWWNDENKELFDTIVDIQPTVEPEETKPCAKNCANCGAKMEKEKKETCGSCEWAMPIKGTINGVYVSYIECQNPEKVWNHNSSRRKKRTTQKCRFWQPKKKGGEE